MHDRYRASPSPFDRQLFFFHLIIANIHIAFGLIVTSISTLKCPIRKIPSPHSLPRTLFQGCTGTATNGARDTKPLSCALCTASAIQPYLLSSVVCYTSSVGFHSLPDARLRLFRISAARTGYKMARVTLELMFPVNQLCSINSRAINEAQNSCPS